MAIKSWKLQSRILINNDRGSILLTSYLVLTSLLILGAAFLLLSTNEAKTERIQRSITLALNIAEAGIERALYDLRQDIINDASSPSWADDDINGWAVDPDDSTYSGNLDSDGFYSFPHQDETTYTQNADYPSTAMNGGSYSVRLKNVSGLSEDIRIRSTGVSNDGTSQTIEVYASMFNFSPWDNAIFGGAGSSGTMVNGNVNIYGSVHILGDGLDPGDDAINLGGTAELVSNNYNVGPQGLAQDLKDKIPDLPTIDFNGETVETLSAELRVKKGLVSLSGNSAVGEADVTGNNVKETIDGAYVTDGYAGDKGEDNVYSDNGTSEAYDLGDIVSFPSLDDLHPLDTSGDYYDYFNNNGLVLTTELANVTPSSSFTYGNCATNCITMDGSGNLQIEGIIYVTGNNTLGMSGGDFEYTGKGTILVTGDVSIDATVVTTGDDSFPNNIMGIMTPGDINIGNTSQEDVMGLFYAEGEINIDKQTDLVGTIITNYFNLSNQVPSIFQVPLTGVELPPGIIGTDDVWLMKLISWEKIEL